MMQNAILETRQPRKHKALGAHVQRFNAAEWDQAKYDYMASAIRLKVLNNYIIINNTKYYIEIKTVGF